VPFVWTKTADEILADANRRADSVTDHYNDTLRRPMEW
jgi:hypothetical protein